MFRVSFGRGRKGEHDEGEDQSKVFHCWRPLPVTLLSLKLRQATGWVLRVPTVKSAQHESAQQSKEAAGFWSSR